MVIHAERSLSLDKTSHAAGSLPHRLRVVVLTPSAGGERRGQLWEEGQLGEAVLGQCPSEGLGQCPSEALGQTVLGQCPSVGAGTDRPGTVSLKGGWDRPVPPGSCRQTEGEVYLLIDLTVYLSASTASRGESLSVVAVGAERHHLIGWC